MSRMTSDELSEVQRGLRMTHPPDAAQIRAEEERLRELEHASVPARTWGYLRLVGPGYMQSAMTSPASRRRPAATPTRPPAANRPSAARRAVKEA